MVEWYIWHMGYVDNSDCMANSCSMSQRTFKWTMKLFCHLLDLTVLNSWILLSSCRAKYTHRDFRFLLVQNLSEELERAMIVPPLDWLEDQMWAQKMFCNSRIAIAKTDQRNRQPICTAVCILLAAKERAQCISVPDVTWACAWCLVLKISHNGKFLIYHPLYEYCGS